MNFMLKLLLIFFSHAWVYTSYYSKNLRHSVTLFIEIANIAKTSTVTIIIISIVLQINDLL